jgi:3-oxoacyl-[acyl-carrier-protein] synthase II
MIPGFAMLQALSRRNEEPKKASRPFDAERDGFVMGEGAAVVVLEDLEHAIARKAPILAEVLGVAVSTDAYRLTDPDPSGDGMKRAMAGALADAAVSTDDIDYINAHGTSTGMNDAAETKAMKMVYGDRAYEIPVSSSKSMFGHLIHAAGTTEAVVCLESMRTGRVHPTINQEVPDPDCDLDYVPNEGRDHECRTVMNNSFGFGGQNVSLVLRRYEGGAA